MDNKIPELTQGTIDTFVNLIDRYCPNLFLFITKKEYFDFVKKSQKFIIENDGKNLRTNFLSTLIELHKCEIQGDILKQKIEFDFFNNLLKEAHEKKLGKKFKSFIKGAILNFSDQKLLDVFGELAALLTLDKLLKFEKYEYTLSNGKTIDFHFIKDKQIVLVEAFSISIDINKYDKKTFKNLVAEKVLKKYQIKTLDLNEVEKSQIYIFPILSGLSPIILKEQKDMFLKFNNIMRLEYGANSFPPHTFCQYDNQPFKFLPAYNIL